MKTKLQKIVNTNEVNKNEGIMLIDWSVNKDSAKINKWIANGDGFAKIVFTDVNVNLQAKTFMAWQTKKSEIAFHIDLFNKTCKIEFCTLEKIGGGVATFNIAKMKKIGYMKYTAAEVTLDDVKEYFKEIGLDVDLEKDAMMQDNIEYCLVEKDTL